MWDYLGLGATLMFAPSLLPILLNRSAYIPRLSSIPTTVGLVILFFVMANSGLVLTSGATGLSALAWFGIALMRGRKPNA